MNCKNTQLTVMFDGKSVNSYAVNYGTGDENRMFIALIRPLITFKMRNQMHGDNPYKMVLRYRVCNIDTVDIDKVPEYNREILRKCTNTKDWMNLPKTERRDIDIETQKNVFATDKMVYYKSFIITISQNADNNSNYDLTAKYEWSINHSETDDHAINREIRNISANVMFQKINGLLSAMSVEPETILTDYDIDN